MNRDLASVDAGKLVPYLCALLLAAIIMATGCSSGGNNNNNTQGGPSATGNWQFTVASPTDQSFTGGLQGGFLVQQGSTITGQAVYVVSLPQSSGTPTVCSSGSATITGTLNGQNVTLNATGAQTFSFTGTLSMDGTTMAGTYSSTAGTYNSTTGPAACGTAQTGLQWSAALVPALSGSVQGNFHSTFGPLQNQDFTFTGLLTQGQNIGASSATVTGYLNFVNPSTGISDYPCLSLVNVNGQISGSSLILQLIGQDGSNAGQIGGVVGSGLGTVTLASTPHGYVVQSTSGPAYVVNSTFCPSSGLSAPGDEGNLCLSLSTTACQQPILLTPGFLSFPSQTLGSAATSQTITLTNTSPTNSTLNGLQAQLVIGPGSFPGFSDFDGLPNFTESDTCATSPGSPFSLEAGKSCTITVSFAPQESCPWLPYPSPPSIFGASPTYCPFPLTTFVAVQSPSSADADLTFSVPITGYGASALVPSTPELGFGSEAVSEASVPQMLSFTNQSPHPVQILGAAPCLNIPPTSGINTLPVPLQTSSGVAGLQVVANGAGSPTNASITANVNTIQYSCDSDPTTLLPNFQISSDTCTGNLVPALGMCSLQITFVPQSSSVGVGLDFFLELNTLQCSSVDGVSTNCEIDSGRFPVELRSNAASPLRMIPAAGLNFGTEPMGNRTATQEITLFNDPADPNTATISLVGKITASHDYSETDNCPFSLAPGSSCTINVSFKPTIVGADPGTVTINYTPEPTGVPQIIYLTGAGQ